MSIERTFGIVKPDAVAKSAIGGGIGMIENGGLKGGGVRLGGPPGGPGRPLYAGPQDRPVFHSLVKFMTSGPAVVMAIEGENAIARYREIMGPTDSKKAPAGTIRNKYGTDIEKNAVHGSDGPDTARAELSFFFAGLDLP